MKPMRIATILSTSLPLSTTVALAETGARQDNSQLLVWAFLGMCALIVVIQLMPVVMIAFGLVKGLFREKRTPAQAEVTSDN